MNLFEKIKNSLASSSPLDEVKDLLNNFKKEGKTNLNIFDSFLLIFIFLVFIFPQNFLFTIIGGTTVALSLVILMNHLSYKTIIKKAQLLMESNGDNILKEFIKKIKNTEQKLLLEDIIEQHLKKTYDRNFLYMLTQLINSLETSQANTLVNEKIESLSNTFALNTPQKITPQEKYKEMI